MPVVGSGHPCPNIQRHHAGQGHVSEALSYRRRWLLHSSSVATVVLLGRHFDLVGQLDDYNDADAIVKMSDLDLRTVPTQ